MSHSTPPGTKSPPQAAHYRELRDPAAAGRVLSLRPHELPSPGILLTELYKAAEVCARPLQGRMLPHQRDLLVLAEHQWQIQPHGLVVPQDDEPVVPKGDVGQISCHCHAADVSSPVEAEGQHAPGS